LIPRNDTEIMIHEVLKITSPLTSLPLQGWPGAFLIGEGNNKYSLIDVWTGSSCISISILKNRNNIFSCYVIDISEEALEVSKINIKKHKLENEIISIKWDLLEPFLCENSYKLHKIIVITANLPYIKDKDYENMDNSVIKYEPKLALYGWKWTWFELYQKLISQCLELKKKYNIILFIEIGFDQKQIAEGFLNNLWLKYEIFKDNGWVDRCIKISFE